MEIRIQWLSKCFPPFGDSVTILLFGFFVRALYVAHITRLDLFDKKIFHFSAASNSRSSCEESVWLLPEIIQRL
jgi:hypothetical protein